MFRDHVAEPSGWSHRLAAVRRRGRMRERTPFRAELLDAAADAAAARHHRHGERRRSTWRRHGARHHRVRHPGAAPTPTAELTWALILGLLRHMAREEARSARRRLADHGRAATWPAGRSACSASAGSAARWPRIGTAFGMEVIAWSQNLTRARARRRRRVGRPRTSCSPRSDVVTIHLVLSDRTRGLVGARELALMKPTALLVNTSRGPIVEQDALVAALTATSIAGAGSGRVRRRAAARPDHPLRTLPNVLATPHIGYVTEDLYRIFYSDAARASPPGWTGDDTLEPANQQGLRPAGRAMAREMMNPPFRDKDARHGASDWQNRRDRGPCRSYPLQQKEHPTS